MRKEFISGQHDRLKPRFGVIHTQVQRDRTKYTRKAKHPARERICKEH